MREMTDVTDSFAASELKIKIGHVSVAVSSIFSTQYWCSALPLALMGTVVGSFCGFANHPPRVHIGLREECAPCDISKEILGTQQRKDSV